MEIDREHRPCPKWERRSIKINGGINRGRDFRAADSLTRTKALLLAALKVWELKQRGEN